MVAGDVAHSVAVIERTLTALKAKFDEVFYTVRVAAPASPLLSRAPVPLLSVLLVSGKDTK